jgi:dynein heavy chain
VKNTELEEQSKTLAAEKSEVEAALAEALPELEAARLALSQLDKSDITELRLRMHDVADDLLFCRIYFYFKAYFSTNYPVRISMSFGYFLLFRDMSRQI